MNCFICGRPSDDGGDLLGKFVCVRCHISLDTVRRLTPQLVPHEEAAIMLGETALKAVQVKLGPAMPLKWPTFKPARVSMRRAPDEAPPMLLAQLKKLTEGAPSLPPESEPGINHQIKRLTSGKLPPHEAEAGLKKILDKRAARAAKKKGPT